MQQAVPEWAALTALTREQLDITDRAAVRSAVEGLRPDWVVNAAAYTQVDLAEREPEAAFTMNRDGAAHLAEACAHVGARMVQISTDYVFDGTKGAPYLPDDTPNPLNVYGESKLAGELAVRAVLGDHALILRTSWVYSLKGPSFLTTMLRLMAEREELVVVDDQIGTPTSSASLALVIFEAMRRDLTGVYHWTDAGVASWYDFAVAIAEEAVAAGKIGRAPRVRPIPSSAYPTPARRPSCAVLDKTATREALGTESVHWRLALRQTLVPL